MMNPTQQLDQFDTAQLAVGQVLRLAAGYLRHHGWIQGDYFARDPETDDIASSFPPACAAGAIGMAICGRVTLDSDRTDNERDLYRDTTETFNDWLNRVDPDFFDLDHIPDSLNLCDLHGWNDHHSRTPEQVITALTDAANDWDRQHPGGAA